MQKNQLMDALNMIQDENTVIRGTFEFDREFSATYECRIIGVTLTYGEKFDAVIHFKEVKQEKAKEKEVIAISKVENLMTKDKLMAALSLIADDEANLYADFTFDDPWGNSSYRSFIYGVEFNFTPKGTDVLICTKEAKEGQEVAA